METRIRLLYGLFVLCIHIATISKKNSTFVRQVYDGWSASAKILFNHTNPYAESSRKAIYSTGNKVLFHYKVHGIQNGVFWTGKRATYGWHVTSVQYLELFALKIVFANASLSFSSSNRHSVRNVKNIWKDPPGPLKVPIIQVLIPNCQIASGLLRWHQTKGLYCFLLHLTLGKTSISFM